MLRIHDIHRVCGPISMAPVLFAGLVGAGLLGSPTDARSSEAEMAPGPVGLAATVWMLSAPHTGNKICEVPAATPIRFINRSNHGPHRYARVEVLEGDCAGEQGYVPWNTLEPEPQEN